MKLTDELRTQITESLDAHISGYGFSIADEEIDEIIGLVERFYGQPASGGFEDGRRHGLTEALNAVNLAARDGYRGSLTDTAPSLQARAVRAIDHIRSVSIAGAPATQSQAERLAEPEEADALSALRQQLEAAREEVDYWRTSSPQSVATIRDDTFGEIVNMMSLVARQKVQMRQGEATAEFVALKRLVQAKQTEARRIDLTHALIHAEDAVTRPVDVEPWATAHATLRSVTDSLRRALSEASLPFGTGRARKALQRAADGVFIKAFNDLRDAAEYDAQQTLDATKKEKQSWRI